MRVRCFIFFFKIGLLFTLEITLLLSPLLYLFDLCPVFLISSTDTDFSLAILNKTERLNSTKKLVSLRIQTPKIKANQTVYANLTTLY